MRKKHLIQAGIATLFLVLGVITIPYIPDQAAASSETEYLVGEVEEENFNAGEYDSGEETTKVSEDRDDESVSDDAVESVAGSEEEETADTDSADSEDLIQSNSEEESTVQGSAVKQTNQISEEAEENTIASTEKSDQTAATSGSSTARSQNSQTSSSNTKTQSSSSKGTSSSGGTSTYQECEHNWVTHAATGHYETKVVKEAYDETVEDTVEYTIEKGSVVACNVCGADMASDFDYHLIEHGAYHTELYQVGYCYYCGGKIVLRRCSFNCSDKCAAAESYQYTYYDSANHLRYMYRQSCSCKKNTFRVNAATGNGMYKTTTTVHHDAETKQVWVEDTAEYTECSICGKKK